MFSQTGKETISREMKFMAKDEDIPVQLGGSKKKKKYYSEKPKQSSGMYKEDVYEDPAKAMK